MTAGWVTPAGWANRCWNGAPLGEEHQCWAWVGEGLYCEACSPIERQEPTLCGCPGCTAPFEPNCHTCDDRGYVRAVAEVDGGIVAEVGPARPCSACTPELEP